LSARSTPFGFTGGRLAITRGDQFILKLQQFVGRHGGLLALRRQIVDREIAVGLPSDAPVPQPVRPSVMNQELKSRIRQERGSIAAALPQPAL